MYALSHEKRTAILLTYCLLCDYLKQNATRSRLHLTVFLLHLGVFGLQHMYLCFQIVNNTPLS